MQCIIIIDHSGPVADGDVLLSDGVCSAIMYTGLKYKRPAVLTPDCWKCMSGALKQSWESADLIHTCLWADAGAHIQ